MVDSWKSMNLNKLVINDEMINYVLEKYVNKWQVDDVISDEILDDLLKGEFNIQQHLKGDDKANGPLKDDKGDGLLKLKDFDSLHKGNVVLVDTTDDIPPSTHPFQTRSDDTLKSSFEDTRSSDDTCEQKKLVKKVTSKFTTTIPSQLLKWYDDLSSDDHMTVFKGKPGSSSTSFQGKNTSSSKLSKAKSRSSSKSLIVKKLSSSKHLTPRIGLSSNSYQAKLMSSPKDVQVDVGANAGSLTLFVPTKRPPPLRFGPCSSENLGTNSE
ncbi:hypothetical protein Tco_0674807 [Tanacetum coccineum]